MTRAQIDKLYREAIGRSARQGEIAWHIQNNTSKQDLEKFLYSNPDARPERESEITRIYQEYIGRPPTPSDIRHHFVNRTSLSDLENWASQQAKQPEVTGQKPPETPGEQDVGQTKEEKPSAPQEKKPGINTGEATLIKFTTSPNVYDISSGELRHVSQQEFSARGYRWSDIQNLDPGIVGLKKQEDGDIFVSVEGEDIHVPDMNTFNEVGFSTAVFKGVETAEPNAYNYFQEILNKDKLMEVYNERPDLQQLWDRKGKGRKGTSAEGTNLEWWAMNHGYREHPDRLDAYKPTNVVRAAYFGEIRGEDPFDPQTYDPAAYSWVEAIKNGEITSYDALTGKIKVDSGGEYDSLTDAEKLAIKTSALIPPESIEDIPKFSEFFEEKEIRQEVEKQINKFYNKELKDYLEGKEITEKRAVEDWKEYTGELAKQKEEELTDQQLQFRQSLKRAIEGYGAKGLSRSSIRRGGEARIRKEHKTRLERIQEEAKRRKKEATKKKKRTLEDIARTRKLKKEEIKAKKPVEVEKEVTTRRAQSLAEYIALKEGTLKPEDLGY